MRKIGTISSALSLIFLGLWLFIRQTDPSLAQDFYSWWPVILIILGIEVIALTASSPVGTRPRFNFLIILFIFIFMLFNLFYGFEAVMNEGGFFKRFSPDNYNYSLNHDLGSIGYDESFAVLNNSLTLKVNNASLKLIDSSDTDFKVKGKIFFQKRRMSMNYTPETKNTPDNKDGSFIIDFTGEPKAQELTIFLPKDCKLTIIGDNVQVLGADGVLMEAIDIQAANGNVDIRGTMPFMNIALENGRVNVKNQQCKNVVINLKNGLVVMNTEDKNLTALVKVYLGTAELNGDTAVSSSLVSSLGTAKGKVSINVNSGVAKFFSE